MTVAGISARLTIDIQVNTFDDGIATAQEAKADLVYLLGMIANLLINSNEDNFNRPLLDDDTGQKFGAVMLAISSVGAP